MPQTNPVERQSMSIFGIANSAWRLPWPIARRLYERRYTAAKRRLGCLERAAFLLLYKDPTLEHLRTRVLKRAACSLTKHGIRANHISLFGCFLATSVLLVDSPAYILIIIAANLFLDGLDGVVARWAGEASVQGAALDVSCDTIASICFLTRTCRLLSVGPGLTYTVTGLTAAYVAVTAVKNYHLLGKPIAIGTRINSSVFCIVACITLLFDGSSQIALRFLIQGILVAMSAMVALSLMDNLTKELSRICFRRMR